MRPCPSGHCRNRRPARKRTNDGRREITEQLDMDVLLILVIGGESSLACSGWVNVEHCGTIKISISIWKEPRIYIYIYIYLMVVICGCLPLCQRERKREGMRARDTKNHWQWKVNRSGLSR